MNWINPLMRQKKIIYKFNMKLKHVNKWSEVAIERIPLSVLFFTKTHDVHFHICITWVRENVRYKILCKSQNTIAQASRSILTSAIKPNALLLCSLWKYTCIFLNLGHDFMEKVASVWRWVTLTVSKRHRQILVASVLLGELGPLWKLWIFGLGAILGR